MPKVRHFMNGDLPVAQLCHAPLVLATAGTLNGRRSAAYPALAPDVAAAGAEFVDAGGVVDGQMVSARAWPDHPAWMREFVRILRSKAPVDSRNHGKPAFLDMRGLATKDLG
jgi:protease I